MDNDKFKRILPLLGVGALMVFLVFMSVSTFMISSRASRQQNVTESYAEEFLPGATLPPGKAWQNMTISGELEGRMTIGYKLRPDDSCGTDGVKLVMGKIDDKDYVFNFSPVSPNGPSNYKGYLQLSPLDFHGDTYGGNVLLTVNEDERSGSVAGDIYNNDKTVKKIHISGEWACP